MDGDRMVLHGTALGDGMMARSMEEGADIFRDALVELRLLRARCEPNVVDELPMLTDLERLVRKIQSFPETPVNRLISPSDINELKKAIGLIDAIVFTPEEDDDDAQGETPDL